MTECNTSGFTRRFLLGAFAATAVTAAPTFSNAAGFLRGGGDIRRIRMYSGRTGERIDMIYWIDGKYIKDAVKEVNHFMRDWRTDGIKSIDLRTIDVMAAAHSHSIYGKAFSALGKTLRPLSQDTCAFYDDHVVFARGNDATTRQCDTSGINKAECNLTVGWQWAVKRGVDRHQASAAIGRQRFNNKGFPCVLCMCDADE